MEYKASLTHTVYVLNKPLSLIFELLTYAIHLLKFFCCPAMSVLGIHQTIAIARSAILCSSTNLTHFRSVTVRFSAATAPDNLRASFFSLSSCCLSSCDSAPKRLVKDLNVPILHV